ncbi:MAG TPA: hypothetical protein VGB18_00775, partial [Candidatus Thermoplasmatota archaeon]
EAAPGSEVRERSDLRLVPDLALGDHHGEAKVHTIADRGVREERIAVDLAVATDLSSAAQMDVRADDGSGADGHPIVEKDVLRILEDNPALREAPYVLETLVTCHETNLPGREGGVKNTPFAEGEQQIRMRSLLP